MSIAIRAVAAALPLCTVCVTGPPVADAAEIVSAPTTIGIADSDLYGMSQADIDKTLDTLQSLGVQDIRVFVPWALVEPAQGTYNWTYLDDVINAAAARNMGIMAEINSTPAWDAASGTIPGAGAPDATSFANFATRVATRYGNAVSAYEIWNEPNYAGFYEPIDPAGYTALLKAAYPAIKAVDPTATVVAGALGSVISFGGITMDPTTFVSDMYADGAKGYFDALSFHPYQESLEFSQGATVPSSPLQQLATIYNLMTTNGDGAKDIWISEYGLPTSDVSQQQQANYIKDILDTWKTESYAGPIFIYTAQDTNSASTNPQDTYGIYQSDWTPKLAAAVIQQEIAADKAATATNPLATLGQQIGTALAQALNRALPTLVQQFAQSLAQALAQALANAFAPQAATAATPAVMAAKATTPGATTPAVTTAATTPAARSLAVTASASAPSATGTVKALHWKRFQPDTAGQSAPKDPVASPPSSPAVSTSSTPAPSAPAPTAPAPSAPSTDSTSSATKHVQRDDAGHTRTKHEPHKQDN
jgi:hypothetical protein